MLHGRVEDRTVEVCDLRLVSQNTTLKVPVQSRSPGVFPLTVTLETPGGAFVITSNNDTVRSTAVSEVGLVLIIVALLSLAIWWMRDLRHGRRARRLVPAPVEDDGETRTSDPVVDAFFLPPSNGADRDPHDDDLPGTDDGGGPDPQQRAMG